MQPATMNRYLGGVLDFTGELNRYAVLQATRRDVEAVRACRGLVEGIFGQFLQVCRCVLVTLVTLLCSYLQSGS
jgi:predicted translin family RNA/ssDNA-binding protein